MFACLECGKKLRTVTAAEKAANEGCPNCGGVDIDTDVSASIARRVVNRIAVAKEQNGKKARATS